MSFDSEPERIISTSGMELDRGKSPAGCTEPPRLLSGVLRSARGRSPRGSTGSRAGQKSFRPGAALLLHRQPSIFQAPAAMMSKITTANVTPMAMEVAAIATFPR